MKNQSRLLVVLGLLLPMSVWSQGAGPVKQFLNLYYKSKQLYIGLHLTYSSLSFFRKCSFTPPL